MTSKYIYVNFPNLKYRNYSNPKNSPCSLCTNNYMKHCSCVFEEGNDDLPDHFNPSGKVLYINNQIVRPANYWDKAVHLLLNYEIDVIDEEQSNKQVDIKQSLDEYHQW